MKVKVRKKRIEVNITSRKHGVNCSGKKKDLMGGKKPDVN